MRKVLLFLIVLISTILIVLLIAMVSVGFLLFNTGIVTKNILGDGYTFEYSSSLNKSYFVNLSVNKTFEINNTSTQDDPLVDEYIEEEHRNSRSTRSNNDITDEEDEIEQQEEQIEIVLEELQENISEEQNEEIIEETPEPVDQVVFSDDFSSYSITSCVNDADTIGPWNVVFSGYGCVDVVEENSRSWLRLIPRDIDEDSQMHSTLVIGPEYSSVSMPFTYSVNFKTTEQLRDVDPFPWEVGWIVWNYEDNEHFYYVILKPNGWELGKRDPAYPGGQRFLATGTSYLYPINNEYDISILQDGATITLYAQGNLLTTFTDFERPYLSGNIGMYTEDAEAYFTDVVVS